MIPTYPHGYGTTLLTLEQVRTRHQARYHPEAWRRIEAAMVAARGLLGLREDQGLCGIGGGARTREEQAASYARDPNTFAPPDRSFHQVWTWASGATGAQAVDWVGRDGRHGEAWRWLRDHGGLYGLRTFHDVNGEPWHTQCADVPLSVQAWLNAGRPDPGVWVLPGSPPQPPSAPGWGLWPLNKAKPILAQGAIGDAVRYLQDVLRQKAGQAIAVDGQFGPATTAAVRNLQNFVRLDATGVVARPTWDVIDHLAGYVEPAPAPPPPPAPAPPAPAPQPPAPAPGTVTNVTAGLYYVQRGDSPWRAAQVCYGNGALWDGRFTQAQFATPDVQIPAPGLPGRTTVVQPGDGPWRLVGRLYPGSNVAALLPRFYALNGGEHRTLHPGDVVYMDDPR